MSQARIKAQRLTEEAEFLKAAADLQDELADAKEAHTANPTPETYAAKQKAMARMAEFRSWTRGVSRLRELRRKAADPELPAVQREAVERELPQVEELWGDLEAELSELRASAGPVPLPEGSAVAHPEPARMRGIVNGGGA